MREFSDSLVAAPGHGCQLIEGKGVSPCRPVMAAKQPRACRDERTTLRPQARTGKTKYVGRVDADVATRYPLRHHSSVRMR